MDFLVFHSQLLNGFCHNARGHPAWKRETMVMAHKACWKLESGPSLQLRFVIMCKAEWAAGRRCEFVRPGVALRGDSLCVQSDSYRALQVPRRSALLGSGDLNDYSEAQSGICGWRKILFLLYRRNPLQVGHSFDLAPPASP